MRDMTPEMVEAHNARVRAGRGGAIPTPPPVLKPRKEGRVKGAQATVVDGIKFQSKKEARRYQELKIIQRSEGIRRLRRQVTFPLITKGVPVFPDGYVADFVYDELQNGVWVYTVEDCKGFKTEIYKVKRQLMFAIYGITIKES